MTLHLEELDFQSTPIGDLLLRRRRMPELGDTDIYEVKLGEHWLMTSLFHEAEVQLAHKGLAAATGDKLDVIVGGLGLGYTAVAALENQNVASLVIVDALEAVIGWHQQEIVPLGKVLNDDPRSCYLHDDFFALARDTTRSFNADQPDRRYHAILLDVDHTPTHNLAPANAHCYSEEGLRELATHLHPGGVFALWADGVPEAAFTERLSAVFDEAQAHTIRFPNPITGDESTGAVYVATTTPIANPSAN